MRMPLAQVTRKLCRVCTVAAPSARTAACMPGRDLREDVVRVHHVGPEGADGLEHGGDPARGVRRLVGGAQPVPARPDRGVVEEQGLHDLPGAAQARHLLGHHRILATAHLIAVVNHEDAQGRGR